MAKIILGKRPQVIESVISATLPTGDTGAIKARYVYRTRSEFGAMIDKRMAEARNGAEPPAEFSVADMQCRARDANAAYLLDILAGWDLDEDLNMESATQLCDEAPAMAQALIDGYRLAVTEGRLGN